MSETRSPWPALVAAAGVCSVAVFTLPGLVGEYRLAKWALAAALTGLLAALMLVSIRRDSGRTAALDPALFALVAAFGVAAAVAPLGSTAYPLAHTGASLRLVLGVAFAVVSAMAFAGAGPTTRRAAVATLVAAGAFSATIVILQSASIYPFDSLAYVVPELRATGTFGNPNWAAAFLLALVPVALALRLDAASPRARAWLLALAAVVILGVVATRSKAGILAMVGGCLIFFLSSSGVRARTRWAVAGAAALTVVGTLALGVAGNLSGIPSIHGRLFLWRAALPLVAGHPWTGVGLGGFPPAYPAAAARIIDGDAAAFMPLNTIEFLYNEPLQMAVEGGVVSAVLLVALAALSVRAACRRADPLSRGVGAGLAALSIYGLMDAPLQLPATAMLFWLMVGWIMSGAGRPWLAQAAARAVPRLRLVATVTALVAIVLAAGVQSARLLTGNVLWSAGSRAHQAGDFATAVDRLTAAIEYLPESGRLRLMRARALAADGQLQSALAEIEVSLGLHFDFDAAFSRVRLIEKTAGAAKALQEWQALGRAFPQLVTPHYEAGRILLDSGALHPAAEAFGRILKSRQDTELAFRFQREARAMLARIGDAQK